jgi:prepilin-type processing-associated H-X9-DG protein
MGLHAKKRFGVRSVHFWQLALLLSGIGLLLFVLVPVFGPDSSVSRHTTCQSNLKKIMLGVHQYARDYDEVYPLASASTGGWAEVIQPYVKTLAVYQCPSEAGSPKYESPSPRQPQYTDYWLNQRISGRNMSLMIDPMSQFSLGEGNDGTDKTDSRYSLVAIPSKWRQEHSPLDRHLEFATFAFADGHVKLIAAKAWKNDHAASVGTSNYTFLFGKP